MSNNELILHIAKMVEVDNALAIASKETLFKDLGFEANDIVVFIPRDDYVIMRKVDESKLTTGNKDDTSN